MTHEGLCTEIKKYRNTTYSYLSRNAGYKIKEMGHRKPFLLFTAVALYADKINATDIALCIKPHTVVQRQNSVF
jgi:hypothetical protein